MNDKNGGISRRGFLKGSAAAGAAAVMTGAYAGKIYAAGSDRLRVGLVGCGGRGTGAAGDAAQASPNVRIVAMGDLFADRLEKSREHLKNLGEQYAVDDDHCFVGWDNYQKVIDSDIDIVLLCEPPGFRPRSMRYAIERGRHVFAEKPVAVDAAGVRSCIETAEMAKEKNLSIVAGTCFRHHLGHIETIKRIHDGAIGEIVAAQGYYNVGGLWMHPRKPEWSDVEWQCRNWLYFTWLSGDHLVEQAIHRLDNLNWTLQATPVSAYGMGGRQARVDPAYGHIYDHFAVEYEYPGGVRVAMMSRQIDGTDPRVIEYVVGTKGTAAPSGWIKGENAWKFKGEIPNMYVQEHIDMINGIMSGNLLNEGRQVAETSLTAIMGRMSAYTGKLVTWEQAMESQESLFPETLDFGPMAIPPVAIPGRDPLV